MNYQQSVKVKSYNGMTFNDLVVFPEVKHEFALSVDKKLVKCAPLTLQCHKNAYAYDPELLLSSWSFEYPAEQFRGVSKSPYWRTELILTQLKDKRLLRQWRDSFLEAARICDAFLQGVM